MSCRRMLEGLIADERELRDWLVAEGRDLGLGPG